MITKSIEEYLKDEPSRFHIPGHKGDSEFGLPYDVTELDKTDDLYNSRGPIKESENLVSDIYGSGFTIFSTQGNTLCIQTMLHLVFRNGGKLVVARNCHRSVVSTMGLLGITPVWVRVGCDENVSCEDIHKKLKENPDAKAILVTSPDYFGRMVDIKKIKSFCGDIPLLVDNAHGSHLVFFDSHPISLGADIVADSAHKTLPVLTGGAWLHVSKRFSDSAKISYEDAKESMRVFGSSSPSFVVLISLEKCALWLKKHAKEEFFKLKDKVDKIKKKAKSIFLSYPILDPVRITLETSSLGIFGKNLYDFFSQFNIEPEFVFDGTVVLIPSPFNSDEDWNSLESCINYIYKVSSLRHGLNLKITKNMPNKYHYEEPESKLSIKDAMFSEFETIEVKKSEGFTCAQIVSKCPPGIPILIPGEVIDKSKVKQMKKMKIKHIQVVK